VPGCKGVVPPDRASLEEDKRVKVALKRKRRRTDDNVSSLDVDAL
jgi:hypothetical protein